MSEETPSVAVMVTAAVLALGVAAGAWAGLSALAKPAAAETRLASLETRIEHAQRLARAPGDLATYPAHAVCPGVAQSDLDDVRHRFEAAASQQNLTLSGMALEPMTAQRQDGRLTAVRVSLQTDGAYEAVLTLLDQLGRARPELFVDSVDLTSRTTSVHLALSGKVFCWTAEAP